MPPQHGLPGLDVSLPFSAAPLSHLFLVLPGIGDPYLHHPPFHASLESNLRHLQSRTSSLLFLPLDWHTTASATWRRPLHPHHPPTAIRSAVAETAGDLLLLASPFWRLSIARRLAEQARAHLAAVRRSRPAFSGRVSLLAHSAAAVLAVDLVRHDLLPELDLDAVVLLGAPLAAYAALAPDVPDASCLAAVRRHRGNVRFVNVFHPLDPVAYRLEPFVGAEGDKVVAPVKVTPQRRTFWDEAAVFWEDVVENLWGALFPARRDGGPRERGDPFAPFARGAEEEEEDVRGETEGETVEDRGRGKDGRAELAKCAAGVRRASYVWREAPRQEGEEDAEAEECTGGSEVLLSGRIDYELQDGMGGPALNVMASWGAIKAHAYYWHSLDVAQLLMDVASTSEEALARREA